MRMRGLKRHSRANVAPTLLSKTTTITKSEIGSKLQIHVRLIQNFVTSPRSWSPAQLYANKLNRPIRDSSLAMPLPAIVHTYTMHASPTTLILRTYHVSLLYGCIMLIDIRPRRTHGAYSITQTEVTELHYWLFPRAHT